MEIKSVISIYIDQEYTTYSRITKHFDLLAIASGGDEIEVGVDKWWLDSDQDGYENDYEIENEEEVKKNFTDDEWDELTEYIQELK